MIKKLKLCKKWQNTYNLLTPRAINKSTIQLWTTTCCKSINLPVDSDEKDKQEKNNKFNDDQIRKSLKINQQSQKKPIIVVQNIQYTPKQHNITFIPTNTSISHVIKSKIKKCRLQKSDEKLKTNQINQCSYQQKQKIINNNITLLLKQKDQKKISNLLNPQIKKSSFASKKLAIKNNYIKTFSNTKVKNSLNIPQRQYIMYKKQQYQPKKNHLIRNKLSNIIQCSEQDINYNQNQFNIMRYNSSQIFKTRKCQPTENLIRSGSIVINASSREIKKYNGYLFQAKHTTPQQKQKRSNRPVTASNTKKNWQFLNVKTMRLISNNSQTNKFDSPKSKIHCLYFKKKPNKQQQNNSKLSNTQNQIKAINVYLDKINTQQTADKEDLDSSTSGFKKKKISIVVTTPSKIKQYQKNRTDACYSMGFNRSKQQDKQHTQYKCQQQSDKDEDQKSSYLKTVNV